LLIAAALAFSPWFAVAPACAEQTIRVGIMSAEDEDVWTVVSQEAKKRGLTVKLAPPPWRAPVGAGGLGDLAIRYGYQRFETWVMIAVIVVLIGLVALIQAFGDWLARSVDHR
jgi:hypothetical protein